MYETDPPIALQGAGCVWLAASLVALYAAWRCWVTQTRQIQGVRDETARRLSGGRGDTNPPRFTWWG